MLDAEQEARARAVAAQFDYVLEQDLVALCGVSLSTIESWRKRGKAPKFALVGNQYLYPKKELAELLRSKERASAGPQRPRDLL